MTVPTNPPVTPHPHRLILRDGIRLAGLLWEAKAPRGIVIVRTPYDARRHADLGRSWLERGYHCLVQDVRGRYSSGGHWDPYRHENRDGAQVMADIAERFPNLPVLVFGASYAAHTALEAALGAQHYGGPAPRGIIVLVPALGLAETAWDDSGTAQLEHRIGWWQEHGIGARSGPPLASPTLAARVRRARLVGPERAARDWAWPPAVLQRWERLWQEPRLDLGARYAALTSPLLVVTGSQDFFTADAHRLARAWPAPSHLVSGPWGHRLARDISAPEARPAAPGGRDRRDHRRLDQLPRPRPHDL